jgi:hypothetical protein
MLADRVCYLPQFIGYHYFINGGSIVQNNQKSMDELYECFKSAGLIIDKLSSLGIVCIQEKQIDKILFTIY